jgi:hypothetical protein
MMTVPVYALGQLIQRVGENKAASKCESQNIRVIDREWRQHWGWQEETGATPPLSWHLTEMQKQAIEEEWQLQRNNSQGRKMQDFLDLAARAWEAR